MSLYSVLLFLVYSVSTQYFKCSQQRTERHQKLSIDLAVKYVLQNNDRIFQLFKYQESEDLFLG